MRGGEEATEEVWPLSAADEAALSPAATGTGPNTASVAEGGKGAAITLPALGRRADGARPQGAGARLLRPWAAAAIRRPATSRSDGPRGREVQPQIKHGIGLAT